MRPNSMPYGTPYDTTQEIGSCCRLARKGPSFSRERSSKFMLGVLLATTIRLIDVAASTEISLPFQRYHSWGDLDDTVKEAAESLGYDRASWNVPGTNDVELMKWSNLGHEEQGAAEVIGINEEAWDCYINHYKAYNWTELETEGVQQHWNALGWNQLMWEGNGRPTSDDKSWNQLSTEEMSAAESLCYIKELWDNHNLLNFQHLLPTASPTESPSELPSNVPTVSPSEFPSRIQSEEPSIVPTTEPSFSPSQMPSTLISGAPSDFPSEPPSIADSNMPSFDPSMRPTEAPSVLPTTSPSNSPSDAPTNDPSAVPSQSPTGAPSSRPTLNPSSNPTVRPSLQPSLAPSVLPTSKPSSSPSGSPSVSPSVEPTSAPSLECHDNSAYRSPLNGLACEDHSGTDCTQWQHVGLTVEEVVDLIENCPESCNVDCGTFSLEPSFAPTLYPSSKPSIFLREVDSTIRFLIFSVPGMIDDVTQRWFENRSLQYLSSSLAPLVLDISSVTLNSQRIVDAAPRRLLRRATDQDDEERILSDKVTLLANMTAIADTRLLNRSAFSYHLLSAIESEGFADYIRGGNDFFMEATFSSTIDIAVPTPSPGQIQNQDDSSSSTAAVVISSVVAIAVVAFLSGGYIFLQRQRKNAVFFTFSPRNSNNASTSEDADTDAQLKQGSLFSYEESPCNRSSSDQDMALGSLLGSRSKSRDSTSPSSDGSRGSRDKHGTKNDATSPPPPARQIPPMIVFDNIEQENVEECVVGPSVLETAASLAESEQDSNAEDENDVAPMHVRHIEASSSLAAALTARQKSHAPLTLEDMLCTVTSNDGDDNSINLTSPLPKQKSSRLSHAFSGEVLNDDDSVASTPVKAQEMLESSEHSLRRCLSSGALDRIEPSDELNRLIRNEWDNLGLGHMKPSTSEESSESDSSNSAYNVPRESYGLSSLDHAYGSELSPRNPSRVEKPNMSPTGNDADHSYKEVDTRKWGMHENHVHPSRRLSEIFMRKGTKGRTESEVREPSEGHSIISHESEARISPPIDGVTASSGGIDIIATATTDSNHVRSFSDSPKLLGTHYLSDSSSMVSKLDEIPSIQRSSSEDNPSTRGFRYSFDAPSSGKLGMIIGESTRKAGPVIHTVKVYSPLFGMVQAGDKIVRIDGEDTSHMNTNDVTRLLARKRLERMAGIIRITVLSPIEKVGFECDSVEEEDRGIERLHAVRDAVYSSDDGEDRGLEPEENPRSHLMGTIHVDRRGTFESNSSSSNSIGYDSDSYDSRGLDAHPNRNTLVSDEEADDDSAYHLLGAIASDEEDRW